MNKQKIKVLDYAETITKALKNGVFLTSSAGDKVNTMVIGWGHIGVIWNRPVFVAYVRDCRYTSELLDANPEFTVNVPVNGYKKETFITCGTKSGRDMDKIKECGLTLVPAEEVSVPAIQEFPLTLECRVIYREKQDASRLPEGIREKFYSALPSEHIAYFGEIRAAYMIED